MTTANGATKTAAAERTPAPAGMIVHANLAEAMAAFHMELPAVDKNQEAEVKKDGKLLYRNKYADLAAVSKAALPVLGKHGVFYIAKPTTRKGQFGLRYKLTHAHSGEVEKGFMPLTLAGRAQETGGSITYFRRYVFCTVTGIAADTDDDGASAGHQDFAPRGRRESAGDAFANAAPAPGNRPRREQTQRQQRPPVAPKPLDPEDAWAPAVDAIGSPDDKRAVLKDIHQQVSAGTLDEDYAARIMEAIEARVLILKAQAEAQGGPAGPADAGPPAAEPAADGRVPSEWEQEFLTLLAAADSEAAVTALGRTVPGAMRDKKVDPVVANELLAQVAERKAEFKDGAK